MSEVLAKWYSLTINGTQVSDEVKRRITDITLDVKETGSDVLTIKMVDNNMEYLSADYLAKQAKVSFKCAWYDSRTSFSEFIGYISVVDVNFADSVTLTITCLDESYPMSIDEKTKAWEKIKVSDVAKEIFQSYGLTAHVDDTKYIENSISQSSQTDANFLNSLVSKVTHKVFIWYVKGSDAYFVERKVPKSGGVKLGYRTGNNQILSFNPRLTKGKLKIKKNNTNMDDNGNLLASDTQNSGGNGITGSTSNGIKKRYENGRWVTVQEGTTYASVSGRVNGQEAMM